MVLLRLNVYGHPLAGLIWEKFSRSKLLSLGWKPVSGWECLYKHEEMGLFLSVYVDDFKMAGRKENLAPMWSKIRKVLELDDPVPFDNSKYLGMTQINCQADAAIVEGKREIWAIVQRLDLNLTADRNSAAKQGGENDAQFPSQSGSENSAKTKKHKKKTSPQHAASEVPFKDIKQLKAWYYNMSGYFESTVDKYLEFANLTNLL